VDVRRSLAPAAPLKYIRVVTRSMASFHSRRPTVLRVGLLCTNLSVRGLRRCRKVAITLQRWASDLGGTAQ
jgi:hypothetical protein